MSFAHKSEDVSWFYIAWESPAFIGGIHRAGRAPVGKDLTQKGGCARASAGGSLLICGAGPKLPPRLVGPGLH